MSTTRLLILGVVRIFQPVHGYYVRRELLSWRADQWANVNPGSIYNALRMLTRDGFLEEDAAQDDEPAVRGRTSYRLTSDGETEFLSLLHDALWSPNEYAPDQLFAAIGFMSCLQRDEVAAALDHRAAQIEASKLAVGFKEQTLRKDPHIPDHTAEILRLAAARLDGELAWARELSQRVREGEYAFEGETPRALSSNKTTPPKASKA